MVDFEPSRAQREYLRVRLDNPLGTAEAHAEQARVHRSTVSRWFQDDGFLQWLQTEERRVAREYVAPALLALLKTAQEAEDDETRISALNSFLRHMPGQAAGTASEAGVRAVLEALVVRPPTVAVQVVTGGAPQAGAAERIEKLAMAGGVLSVSSGVGPSREEVVAARQEPPAPPSVAVAYVAAATREMTEALEAEKDRRAEAKPEPETPRVQEVDPWAGVRARKGGDQ